jgi:hypothetical protein
MNLYEKILAIYPSLDVSEFGNSIQLQDDSDNRGPYIKSWTNTEFAQPTQAQLDAI